MCVVWIEQFGGPRTEKNSLVIIVDNFLQSNISMLFDFFYG